MGPAAADDPLLDGLEDGVREERAELLAWLRGPGGFSESDLRRASDQGTLVLLAAGRHLGDEGRFTPREVAQESGMDLDLLDELRRAHGLPGLGPPDVPELTEIDVALARTAARFIAAGVTPEQLVATGRVLGRGLSHTAELMRTVTLELALRPGSSELELARAFETITASMVPLLTPMVDGVLRAHLVHTAREELVTAAERAAGTLPGSRRVAIAFADVVGFTRLGEELDPVDLQELAGSLEELTVKTIKPPVRLVKTIGDAVMLVSPDAGHLVACSLTLLEAAQARELPALRVGVAAGEAVGRAGDWYGRPVNLASRVTGVARTGSVLVTEEVRDGARDAARYSAAGSRRLKGIPGETRLFRARPLDLPQG